MSAENNFEQQLQEIQKNKAEIEKNIKHINKVLSANNYQLRLIQDKEIALYKEYGKKAPKDLTHPEFVKLQKTAIAGKNIILGKYDAIYSIIQEKGIDRELFKNKLNEYLEVCKEKGTQVKSSEEIAKVIVSIKNLKEEIKEISLYDILNKVSQEAEVKTEAIRKSLKEYDFASKIDLIVNRFFPAKTEGYSEEEKEKYVLFFKWAQTVENRLNDEHIELYNAYLSYINEVNPDTPKSLIFNFNTGEFSQAIEKYKNISQDTEFNNYDESNLGI